MGRVGGIFGSMQAAPSYASGLSMAARPGPGAAVAARAPGDASASEFESDCEAVTQAGDSDAEPSLETAQGRSGAPPRPGDMG